jgi:hypothetical protein
VHPDVLRAMRREQVLTWQRTADEYRAVQAERLPRPTTHWRWPQLTRVRRRGAIRRAPASTC